MFNPEEPKKLGSEFVDLVYGFGDGIGADDMANAMEALAAGMAASDELREDTDCAFGYVLAGAAEAWAKRRRDPETPSAG